VQKAIARAIAETAHNTGMTLTVAFDYGSRAEIADAARRLQASAQPATVKSFSSFLYEPDLPPVDVLIRTSGEIRVSNFMLWQAAGAPIYFSPNTWPDFSVHDLDAALQVAHEVLG
jgi:undecaprenyl diphosphate synthase